MNPFMEIYEFIKKELFAKYPALGECYMYDDEEDSRYKEYYIKYNGNLSAKEIKTLYSDIIEDLYKFCKNKGFKDAFKYSTILISRSL